MGKITLAMRHSTRAAVLSLASEGLLSGKMELDRVIRIEKFEVALELATSQNPTFGFAVWSDLREIEIARLRSTVSAEEIRELDAFYLEIVEAIVLPSIFEDAISDIEGDLYGCAFMLESNEKSMLFASIYDAYQAGGWPCGWQGNYPVGRVAVFFNSFGEM